MQVVKSINIPFYKCMWYKNYFIREVSEKYDEVKAKIS
jgi:hypothetical protein